MDSADGLFLNGGTERRLAVMKDSRVGSFGILVLAFNLLIQYRSLGGSARTSALLIWQWISQRLIGMTGNSCGAVSEIVTTMVLAVIAGTGRRPHVDWSWPAGGRA